MTVSTSRAHSPDGVSLAVYAAGDARRPTLVAVHGYPDNHAVWDGLVAELAGEFHVVTYDVRGTGASDKPARRDAYRIERLVDDLATVLAEVSLDEPVHLVGHDWGSIQLWPALTDERLAGRIASFTSVSGPSLDHATVWLRQLRRHPRAALRQLAHSYYVLAFQLPWLPELAIRRGALDRGVRHASSAATGGWRADADKLNGLSLYRANMMSSLRRPRPLPVGIPVQVIAPEDDAFVTPDLAIEAPRPWVADLSVQRIAGSHWVVCEQPEVVAASIREFVGRIERCV